VVAGGGVSEIEAVSSGEESEAVAKEEYGSKIRAHGSGRTKIASAEVGGAVREQGCVGAVKIAYCITSSHPCHVSRRGHRFWHPCCWIWLLSGGHHLHGFIRCYSI
jgi:hypothetical protein